MRGISLLRAALSSGSRHLSAAAANPKVIPPVSPPLLLPRVLFSAASLPAAALPEAVPSGAIAALFSRRAAAPQDVTAQIETLGLNLRSPDAVHSLLLSDLASNYEAATGFFTWATSAAETAMVNSKCYNAMLEIAAANGDADYFWALIHSMKKKGFGVAKATFLKASESFEAKNMEKDAALLKEAYFLNSHENVAPRFCAQICKILQSEDEGSIRSKLEELGVVLSSELVVSVLERIGRFPNKALVFFRWVEGGSAVRIDGRVYNLMARVLGRQDFIEEFRDVLRKIKDGGFELERETYCLVSKRFLNRNLLEDAVDLYRFAMHGSEKPYDQDFVFLLGKIVRNNADLKMVTSVSRIYQKAGNLIKASVFDGVIKSLRGVGRLGECDKVLKAMEEGGFAVDSVVHGKAVRVLCDARKLDEAFKYCADVEESGYILNPQIWCTLIRKYSVRENADAALSCFHKMLERRGSGDVGLALEVLVSGYCKKKEAMEAYEVLKKLVLKQGVIPFHSTYKSLIESLILQGHTEEAFNMLGLMKTHGFPPFIDPLIKHISKFGTVDDATGLLKAMTVKEFPSRTVYMRLFEALFKEGRHEIAQQLLSKSPGSVRNHADVLDLFCNMKLQEPAAAA